MDVQFSGEVMFRHEAVLCWGAEPVRGGASANLFNVPNLGPRKHQTGREALPKDLRRVTAVISPRDTSPPAVMWCHWS